MKPRVSHQKTAALTLVEVLGGVVILFALALIFLPDTHYARPKAPRIECVNNLKQISLSFRLWEGDNGDKYPMSVSVTNGGTMELAAGTNAWFSFLVMRSEEHTSELQSPM